MDLIAEYKNDILKLCEVYICVGKVNQSKHFVESHQDDVLKY